MKKLNINLKNSNQFVIVKVVSEETIDFHGSSFVRFEVFPEVGDFDIEELATSDIIHGNDSSSYKNANIYFKDNKLIVDAALAS